MKKSVEERFWSKVDKSAGPDACWPWTGHRNVKGYGRFNKGDRRLAVASRWVWEQSHGPVPEEMFVCHHCDNPPCCNPAHLFLGTRLDNAADMVRKGRQASRARLGDYAARGDRNGMRTHPERRAVGERNAFAKLTTSAVLEIRRLAANGVSHMALGPMFSIHPYHALRIIQGVVWKHLNPAVTPPASCEPCTPTLMP